MDHYESVPTKVKRRPRTGLFYLFVGVIVAVLCIPVCGYAIVAGIPEAKLALASQGKPLPTQIRFAVSISDHLVRNWPYWAIYLLLLTCVFEFGIRQPLKSKCRMILGFIILFCSILVTSVLLSATSWVLQISHLT